jgi:hypothetical protein
MTRAQVVATITAILVAGFRDTLVTEQETIDHYVQTAGRILSASEHLVEREAQVPATKKQEPRP